MLKEVFEKLYPSVASAKLIVDPISKQSKGYGFVKFGDYNESQKAIMEMNGKYILNKAIKTNQAVWKKYNPETNKGSNVKPYHQKYNKGYNQNTYNSGYKHSPNQYNNNDSYNQPEEPPRQVYTQNINIYLQSLYQQHYLNNVYLNQYLGGNTNSYTVSQDEFKFENSNDNFRDFNNEKVNYNESMQNYNEPYSKMDSSINSDGQ